MKKYLIRIFKVYLCLKTAITIQFNKIYNLLNSPPCVVSTDETIKKIINEGSSISRYGDGEFALMNGENLLFQPYCKELSVRLKEIIRSDYENHIVCIPNVFGNPDWLDEKPKKYWAKYLEINRRKIYKSLNLRKIYYDSLVTRLYMDYKSKNLVKERFERLKELWKNRDIIIVEGTKSRLGLGNDLFNDVRSIKRILCPSINAFSKYENILNEVKKQKESNLILISLGPTATVLAYDLSLIGYQAIDIGHIDIEYEWYLQKAEEKIPIKNKYIGEIPNGTKVSNLVDLRYEKEIIAEIV